MYRSLRERFYLTWSLIPIGALYLGRWGLFLWLFPPLARMAPWQRGAWLTLIRFVLIGVVLWLERGRWKDFFITRHNLMSAIQDGLWISVAFIPIGWLYARLTLGGVYWLPVQDWLITFLAAFVPAGLQEELEYRAFLLGVTQRWKIAPLWAIVLIGLLFGPVHHNRYIWQGDFLTLGIVTAFGFLATWLTLKRQNVAGAIIGHTAMDFLIFLFIGGKVSTL
ncbi:CPBP family intramembrane metalloprotease [Candidatus Parcubacteria bacterium]|nr:MAG: CPBP family intramembrane metalloprotease [Candidatus Parcubacteria bacterium]